MFSLKPAVVISLLTLSAGQTFFATILLLTSRRGHKVANRFLAAFMLCLCLVLSCFLLFDFWRLQLPHTVLAYQPILFVLPPLVWFYLLILTAPEEKVGIKDIMLHLSPAAFVALALLPFYRLDGIEKIEWIYAPFSDGYIQLRGVQLWLKEIIVPIRVCVVVQGLAYSIAALVRIVRHRNRLAQEFSFTKNIDLVWMLYLACSCIGIYAAYLFTVFVDSSLLSFTSLCVGCLLLAIFGYFGTQQEVIYSQQPKQLRGSHNEALKKILPVPEKYKNSMLSEQHVNECHQDLLQYMKINKPYTNPQLSLNNLALEMHLPARELSRIINEKSEKNFMEFINSYRIADAKEALRSSSEIKIIDLSASVGFNSKSAFYEAFKKNTGLTPTQYKQHITVE